VGATVFDMIATSIAIVLLREVDRMLAVKKIGLRKQEDLELQNQELQKTVEATKRGVQTREMADVVRARADNVMAATNHESHHKTVRHKEAKCGAMDVERNPVMREGTREIAIPIAVAIRIELLEASGAVALELNE
jgi:hypothetical protein